MMKGHDQLGDQVEVGEPDEVAKALPLVVQEEIGRRLQAIYGKLASEPLPDKFLTLLRELSSSDSAEKKE